jgi:succinate dehydrogenase / fumarate reductase cytochrome b subunit
VRRSAPDRRGEIVAEQSSGNGARARPISPHLTIYRPQLTSVLSILHRLTGVVLASGAAMLCAWLLTAAAGERYYAWTEWFLTSWLGYALLAAWSWCLFYHLCNGIRHLFWDAGLGLSIRQTYASGAAVVVASFVLTGLSWGLGLACNLAG